MMQGMEAAGGDSQGLNGEKTTLTDIKHFLFAGIPAITDATTKTAGGLNFLGKTLWKDSYTEEIPDRVCVEVDYGLLASKSERLSAAADEALKLGEQIRSYEKEMPFYMQGRNLVTLQLNPYNRRSPPVIKRQISRPRNSAIDNQERFFGKKSAEKGWKSGF